MDRGRGAADPFDINASLSNLHNLAALVDLPVLGRLLFSDFFLLAFLDLFVREGNLSAFLLRGVLASLALTGLCAICYSWYIGYAFEFVVM